MSSSKNDLSRFVVESKIAVMKPHLKLFKNAIISTPTGYSPSQILTAYNINKLSLNGAGIKIGIVDAYYDTALVSDFKYFDNYYKIGNPNALTVHLMNSKVKSDSGWSLEARLDTQWAHALAPMAQIIYIAAASDSLSDLCAAETTALSLGCNVISNSWGSTEFSNQGLYDTYFSGTNCLYFASSGDTGGIVNWPSASKNVCSVGGSSLQLTATGSRISETGWSGSGGGLSTYTSLPSFQSALGGTKRQTPDCSMSADPNYGLSVYDSFSYSGQSGWWSIGGTSASCALWAGLGALMQQQRVTLNKAMMGTSQFLTCIYNYIYNNHKTSLYAADFYQILTGTAGSNHAGAGYNNVCGLGTCDCVVTTVTSTPTILTGTSAPNGGSNGNYYLNTVTGDYYINNNGVWNKLGNIVQSTNVSSGGLVIDVCNNA